VAEQPHTPAALRRRRGLFAAAAFVAVALIAAGGATVWLYARGGGPVPSSLAFLRPAEPDLLAPSGPAEQVLRTLRLAGVERAIVGEERGVAVVRVEAPRADSSADVAIAWQSGLGAMRDAYPGAKRYVVQVYGPAAQPLLEMAWIGDDARGSDDPDVLRDKASVRYLSELGGGS